jgi:hypothetical protein
LNKKSDDMFKPANSQQPTARDAMASVVEAIQKLYQWQYGVRDPSDFTYQLFTLLQVANPEEFAKLAQTYPDEARAFRLWYESKDPVEFFKAHGVWNGPRPRE